MMDRFWFFFQAEDGIRDIGVTGVQTCALPILHLASLWAAVVGSIVSAYFIIAANSWMQHPVGVVAGEDGRPRQVDFLAVLTNNTALAAFSHAVVAALMVAGALLVGIGLWHLRRRTLAGRPTTDVDHAVWRRSVRLGGYVSVAAFLLTAVTRSEEHTSELQSRQYLVCRLLLENKTDENCEAKCQRGFN